MWGGGGIVGTVGGVAVYERKKAERKEVERKEVERKEEKDWAKSLTHKASYTIQLTLNVVGLVYLFYQCFNLSSRPSH